jgi:hypothetical protein
MYTDLKTYEDCCAIVQQDPTTLDHLMAIPNETDRDPIVKDYLLKIVIEGINMMPENENELRLTKRWIPDFTDGTTKYELWLRVNKDNTKPSGFGLACYSCDNTYSNTRCGSRLVFRSLGRAKYAFSQFPELFEGSYLINI